jgi:hypothetical protein
MLIRKYYKKLDLTAIREPIVWKMWEPRRLRNQWASTACYRGSFTIFFTLQKIGELLCILKISRNFGFRSEDLLLQGFHDFLQPCIEITGIICN